jgi:hypothetical protein
MIPDSSLDEIAGNIPGIPLPRAGHPDAQENLSQPVTWDDIDFLWAQEMERRDRAANVPAGYRDAACSACGSALYVEAGSPAEVLCNSCHPPQRIAPEPPRIEIIVDVWGKKFKGKVRLPDGRYVKAGTFKTEAETWQAVRRLAEEIRESA